MTTFNPMDIKEINKAIKSIATASSKVDQQVQDTALSVMAHVVAHGDTTTADKLVHALGKGHRKHALVEYFLAYGAMDLIPATTKANRQAIEAGRIFQYAKDKHEDAMGAVESAINVMWYSFKPEAALHTAFDVHASVKSLVTRITKARSSGLEMSGTVEAVEALRQAIALIESNA